MEILERSTTKKQPAVNTFGGPLDTDRMASEVRGWLEKCARTAPNGVCLYLICYLGAKWPRIMAGKRLQTVIRKRNRKFLGANLKP